MAFDYFSEDEKKNQEDGNQGQGQSLGQESAVVQGNGPAQGGAGTGSASGSFTNLQKYLDANSSLNFGQQVAGRVQDKVNQGQEAQNASESNFRGNVDKGAVDEDKDLLNSTSSNPMDTVSNQDKLDKFLKMRDASYGGPSSLSDDNDDYTNASKGTNDAYQTSEQTKDEGGRKAYLNQEYGSGKGRYDYTPGMQKLDNFLIQNDQGSKDAFTKAQQSGQDLKQNFDTMQQRLNQYATEKRGSTAQTRADTRATLGIDDAGNYNQFGQGGKGAIQQIIDPLDARVAAQRGDLQNYQSTVDPAKLSRDVSQLNPAQVQAFGLNPADFAASGDYRGNEQYQGGNAPDFLQGAYQGAGSFYGTRPQDYLNYAKEGDINRGSLATADQYSRLNALAQLAGKPQDLITNKDAVGSMVDQPLHSFNSGGFTSHVGSQRDAFNGEMQAVMKHYADVQHSGGVTDAQKQRAEINSVRQKYGLDPV